jgi:APA family basic amino acid/polyamine antiporter
LGLGFGLAAVVGSVVGQGILRSPGIVAEATGSPILILGLWLTGALIALLTAFAFVELAAAIPDAGGQFVHIHRALGQRTGLAAALAILFTGVGNVALLNFVTGEYLVRLGVGGGAFSAVELGIAVTVLFTAVNAIGTRIGGASQILFSMLKGGVLIALVVALFGVSIGEAPLAPAPETEWLRAGWLPLGTAILVIISTYNGWWDLAYYGEEIQNPGKQIPRAMFGGIIGVAVIYLLVNAALLQVMTPDEMAGSNFAAADAVGVVFGDRADYLLTLFGVLSVGAIGNLALMTNTRFVFALSRAHVLPKVFAVVARNGTPVWALLFGASTGAALILTGSYTALASALVSMNQGVVVLTLLAAINLRRKEPDLHRPFRIPFYPWPVIPALFVSAALLVVFIVQDPGYALSGFVLVTVTWALIEFVFRRKPVLRPLDAPTH